MRVQRQRLVAALATVGMLAVAVVGVKLSESGADAQLVRGHSGEAVAIRGGTVEVAEVRVGTALKRFGRTESSNGLFVVVRVEVAATGRDKVNLQHADLLADPDLDYDGFGLGGGVAADPGFVTTTELAYEVDPAQMSDLTLELAPVEIVSGYQQHVQIHLGITAANAEEWRTAGQGQVLTLANDTSRGIG